jgi:DNA-binding response OmpR family regulator
MARVPDVARAAEPAPEDEIPERTAGLEPDSADSALTTLRRPAARPHRATPRRRMPTSTSPPPEDESPQEEEEEAGPTDAGEWLVVGRIRLRRGTGEVFAGTRRISVTPVEFAVLELLMTRGGHGVTRDAISAAARTGKNGDELPDPEAILAELRRKTGIRGRGQGVRQERALVYFFGE